MKKTFTKIISCIMVVLMLVFSVPIGQFANLDWSAIGSMFDFKAEAADADTTLYADATGVYTIVGTLENYGMFLYIDQPDKTSYINKITVSGQKYDVKEGLISANGFSKNVGKKVIFNIKNDKVINFSLLTTYPDVMMNVNDIANSWGEDGKINYVNGKYTSKSFSIEADARNLFSPRDTYAEEALKNYTDPKLTDITLTFETTDVNLLYFKEGLSGDKLSKVTVNLNSAIDFNKTKEIKRKVYVNQDYNIGTVLSKEVTLSVTMTAKHEGKTIEETHSKKVLIENKDYYVSQVEWETITYNELLLKLEEKVNECPNDVLNEEDKGDLKFMFTEARTFNSLAGLTDDLDNVEVCYDQINFIQGLKYGGVGTIGKIYLEKIIYETHDEIKSLEGYAGSALAKLLKSTEFNNYIEWYENHVATKNGFKIEFNGKCPIDIIVKDDEGNVVLEIINETIVTCSDDVTAFVSNGEKLFYLPTDINHSIEIIARDNGTMQFDIKEYLNGGIERNISYDDVTLKKGVSYNTISKQIKPLEADEYNFITSEGDIIEYDLDSLYNPFMIYNVAKSLKEKDSFIDIKDYEFSVDDAKNIIDIAKEYFEITYGYSCDGTFTYDVVYDSHKNTIVKFKFNYGTDLDSTAPANTIDAEVNVLNEIKAYTNGMSDFDKAIYIHDYLILNGEYDIELGEIIENTGTLSEELRKERYEKYALLVNGTGVCDTYASAYQYLMTNCGVECITVSSTAMNHAWNMVKLNGSWYHVDCTWDDPVADRVGLSRYDFFLLNTNEMKDNEHYSWSPSYTSTSSTYSAITRDDTDEVSYGEGHWCYYENGDLYYSDVYGKNAVKITEMDFDATDIYNGNIYGVIGKVLYRISLSDASGKAYAIYALNESPRAIYIDKNGILEYYTNGRKSFETVDVNKCNIVESLTISADKNVISGGEDLQLSVVAHTSGYDIELAGDAVTWSSSDIAVATVDSYGLVTPDVAGTVVITAAFGNITADFTVEVEKWNHSIGGSITNGISWSFDEDAGILNISGDSEIQSFTSDKETPWYKYRSRIIKLDIADGITGIGEYAFAGLDKIKAVKVPDSVEKIDEYAFNGCNALEKLEIPFVGSSRNAYETEDAVLGYIFGKTNNGTVQYYKTDGEQLFGYQYSIPASIKEIIVTDADKISFGAFYNCYALEYLELNDGIIFIGDRILAGNTALTSLKVPFIGSNADANGDYDSVVGYFFGGTDSTGVLQYTSYTNESGSIHLRGYYYAIPETFRNIEVTNDADIPMCAFSTLSFDNIVLSDKTSEIGELAFYGCKSIVSLMILNRNCNIIDTYGMAKFSGTVYGYNNSTAQSFANARKINFVAIDGAGCPHSYGVWNEKVQAKCETGGVEHRICSVCGAEETRTTAPRGHNYSNSWTVDVNPSCEADGSKSRHCTRCSAKTDITAIAQTGHSYGAWYTKVDATCTANGVKARKCGICGDEETEIIVSPGHTPDTKWTVDREATCTQSGSKSKHCIKCGEKLNITSISATGHSFGAWTTVKDATCEDSGLQKRICINCSTERTRTISSTGHDYEIDERNRVEATCTTDGEITYICHCGDSYVEEIPAEGHSFDEDDEKCKVCDFDRTEDCDCGCHKDGIAGFFFRFILFFQKIFKSNQECDCGIYHY